MVRTGKIARLPHAIREAVNEQLRDGKLGVEIIAWLNRMLAVQEVLRDHFDGRPINDQNLTEWKAGGYPDWLRRIETRETVQDWIDEAGELEAEAGQHRSVADCLAAPLAVELRRCIAETACATDLTPKERRDAIIALTHASSQLRRADQSGARTVADLERKAAEQEVARKRELEEKEKKEQRAKAFQAMAAQMQADAEARKPKKTSHGAPHALCTTASKYGGASQSQRPAPARKSSHRPRKRPR